MSMSEEFFEIEIIVKCPDCKARWYDWISYEPDLPQVIEEQCYDCKMLDNLIKNEKNKEINYSELFE